jgi:hypothetical protein
MKCHTASSNLTYVLQVSDGMQTGKIARMAILIHMLHLGCVEAYV